MAAILYKWFFVFNFLFFVGLSESESSTTKHPFYISVTEINLNSSDKTLEVSCKMFADDLEQTINKNNTSQLDISSQKDQSKFNIYIPAYIKSHLNFSVDGKPANLSYIGFEKDKESAFCYFQVQNISSLKKIDISNSILYDFTKDQINIIHVMVNGKRQSTKLNYPDKNVSFSF